MTAINEAKLNLFLQQAVIRNHQTALKLQIHQHFDDGGDYVLFRHSSLYFFSHGEARSVQGTSDKYPYRDYLRFDGEKVSKVDPEYYLGALTPRRRSDSGSSGGSDSDVDLFDNDSQGDGSNNNNNNNNGNNGNNG